jgi:hypothetical protein
MAEWQPIETAPKDGRLIEIWIEPVRLRVPYPVETGEHLESLVFGNWPHLEIGYWNQKRFEKYKELYEGQEVDPIVCWSVSTSNYTPTHWRPIEPPKEQETS